MKFILIIVVMNLTNLSEPSILAHKTYNSEVACQVAATQIPEAPTNLKVARFCVSEDDLLELKRT